MPRLKKLEQHCTEIFKKYMGKKIELDELIDTLTNIEHHYRESIGDDIENMKELWFRFSSDDTLATTIQELEKDLTLNKTTVSNHGLMLDKIEYAIKNDSLEVNYS